MARTLCLVVVPLFDCCRNVPTSFSIFLKLHAGHDSTNGIHNIYARPAEPGERPNGGRKNQR